MTLNIQTEEQAIVRDHSTSKIILPIGFFPKSNSSADYRTVSNVNIEKETPAMADEEPRLSSRSPDEILRMVFDSTDRYIDNGIIGKGQPATILGPGGLGKSRFITQLAVCQITGRGVFGWSFSKRKLKWLIIQAENSNRRLQDDLAKMREWVGELDWNAVQENLVIHTLEADHDSFLGVDNHASAELLVRLIKEVAADVVVFDPLMAFTSGNLNSDATMQKTCKAISDFARKGKADCAIIVLHHTLTGTQGAKKATGYDRGSYGRGSKALQFWTRGQINIAPGSAENNTKLVISCGKNSNGPEFEPFGVRLNPVRMIYEIDSEFNLETWKNELAGKTNSVRKPTSEAIARLVRDLPVSRKALVDLVMDEHGCGKSSAYGLITKAEEAGAIYRDKKKQYTAT